MRLIYVPLSPRLFNFTWFISRLESILFLWARWVVRRGVGPPSATTPATTPSSSLPFFFFLLSVCSRIWRALHTSSSRGGVITLPRLLCYVLVAGVARASLADAKTVCSYSVAGHSFTLFITSIQGLKFRLKQFLFELILVHCSVFRSKWYHSTLTWMKRISVLAFEQIWIQKGKWEIYINDET